MKQYKAISSQNGFLFTKVRNTMVDSAEFVRPTMYSGQDINGIGRLLPDSNSVFKLARIQGVRTLHADDTAFRVYDTSR